MLIEKRKDRRNENGNYNFASHGEFAQGLKQTATMIIGDSVPIHALSAFRDEDESILVQIKNF